MINKAAEHFEKESSSGAGRIPVCRSPEGRDCLLSSKRAKGHFEGGGGTQNMKAVLLCLRRRLFVCNHRSPMLTKMGPPILWNWQLTVE